MKEKSVTSKYCKYDAAFKENIICSWRTTTKPEKKKGRVRPCLPELPGPAKAHQRAGDRAGLGLMLNAHVTFASLT